MVVSTAQAKGAATSIVQKELRGIAEKLLQIPAEDRDGRVELLKKLKNDIQPETKNFLDLTAQREIEHYELMEVVISKVPEVNFEGRKPHDFSKDHLFYFTAASYFDGGVQHSEMKSFVDDELRRHYTWESHHPEHELYNDVECSDVDIIEMSLDRLARNAQFGDGVISLPTLKKFLPKFPKGDNEAKQKLFWDSALKYQDLVQETFFDIYPEARAWANPPRTSGKKGKCVLI